MNKHILIYCTVTLLAFLIGGCNKYERTEVFPEVYVNKSSIRGFIGEEVQLTASPTDGGYSFQWASENPQVASVSHTGLVKLLSEGNAVIVLSAGDIRQRVEVSSLLRISVTDVTLSDAAVELVPLTKKNVTAKILPDNANDIPKAAWSSENPQVATVTEKGEVNGVSEGSTFIVYTVGTIVKKIKVTVSYTRPFNGPHILQPGPAKEIMAADFDFGGMGRAFNDDPGSNVNNDSYRRAKGDANSIAVEIEGAGNNIGFINVGEWYQYTVEVKETGNYRLQLSLSAAAASKFHIEVDNVNVTGSVNVASNGSWSSWVYHPGVVLNLATGSRKIKVFVEQANFNIRALKFSKE